MGQKEMTVNILPTRTWNRLGMNESQIQIEWPEESVLIKPERLAAGVTWEKEISGKEWDEIQTGMGREYDAMAAECGTAGANRTDTVNGTAVTEENAGAGSIYRLTAEAAAVLQNENTEWTVLCVDYKNGSYQNRLCLDAKENSRLNVLIVFRSGEDAQGTSSFQVKVHAEKNAKSFAAVRIFLNNCLHAASSSSCAILSDSFDTIFLWSIISDFFLNFKIST